mmetsp:Transcript_79601/g.234087  ORF Transcript_79601/g.234087 Transcript_79601/m.234087 type:complete len:202 (+) Transcript_79601:303-908(+)
MGTAPGTRGQDQHRRSASATTSSRSGGGHSSTPSRASCGTGMSCASIWQKVKNALAATSVHSLTRGRRSHITQQSTRRSFATTATVVARKCAALRMGSPSSGRTLWSGTRTGAPGPAAPRDRGRVSRRTTSPLPRAWGRQAAAAAPRGRSTTPRSTSTASVPPTRTSLAAGGATPAPSPTAARRSGRRCWRARRRTRGRRR